MYIYKISYERWTMKKKSSEITLKGLLNIFLPQWWIILIISFVCAALLGVFSYMKPDTYTSTGKYMISKVNMSDSSAQTGLNAQEVEAMHVMIENASEMIKTNNFAEKVRERLNDQADSKGEIDLSTITCRPADPETAPFTVVVDPNAHTVTLQANS